MKYLVIRIDLEHGKTNERVVGRTEDADLAFKLQALLGEMFPASDFVVVAKQSYEEVA